MKTQIALCFLTALILAPHSYAQQSGRETRVTLHSTVTGNQEQPRVMYIVPWGQPTDSTMEYSLQRSIASELFDPVDRAEFIRGMQYQTKINEVKRGEDHGKL